MARVKIAREFALKAFVESLKESFGGKTFTRKNVEQIGKLNGVGLTMFASQSQGYGKHTRLGQGMYTIPEIWDSGKAPWDGVVENTATVAPKATKVPKAKIRTKTEPKAETVEVVENIVTSVKSNIKKALSKKELFEKAKAEIAKKKAGNTASV